MKAVRILLDEAASKHLTEHGADAFAVVARGSCPDHADRWRLWLVPCSVARADSAVKVATGAARAVKVKTDRESVLPPPPIDTTRQSESRTPPP